MAKFLDSEGLTYFVKNTLPTPQIQKITLNTINLSSYNAYILNNAKEYPVGAILAWNTTDDFTTIDEAQGWDTADSLLSIENGHFYFKVIWDDSLDIEYFKPSKSSYYTIQNDLTPPSISISFMPDPGFWLCTITSRNNPSGNIYYKTDNTNNSENNEYLRYTDPFEVSGNCLISAYEISSDSISQSQISYKFFG